MISSKRLFQSVDQAEIYLLPEQPVIEQHLKSANFNPKLSEKRINRIASLLAKESMTQLEVLEIIHCQFRKENTILASNEILKPALDAILGLSDKQISH